MNAGSTTRDGNCVVTFAKQNDQTYVCVVMGGKETDGIEFGYRIANRVVDWVFNAYTYMQILTPNTKICTVDVTVSDTVDSLDVIVKDSLHAFLPKGLEIGKDITYSIRLTKPNSRLPFKRINSLATLPFCITVKCLVRLPYTQLERHRAALSAVDLAVFAHGLKTVP